MALVATAPGASWHSAAGQNASSTTAAAANGTGAADYDFDVPPWSAGAAGVCAAFVAVCFCVPALCACCGFVVVGVGVGSLCRNCRFQLAPAVPTRTGAVPVEGALVAEQPAGREDEGAVWDAVKGEAVLALCLPFGSVALALGAALLARALAGARAGETAGAWASYAVMAGRGVRAVFRDLELERRICAARGEETSATLPRLLVA